MIAHRASSDAIVGRGRSLADRGAERVLSILQVAPLREASVEARLPLAAKGAVLGVILALLLLAPGGVVAVVGGEPGFSPVEVFQLELDYSLWLPLAATAGGALFAVAIGWLGFRRLLRTAPLLALRNGN